MESTLDLQVLTPSDWLLLKTARLDALKDSPHAFLSRYDDEWSWSEIDWRCSIEAATWVVARNGRRAIGLAKSVAERNRPSVRYLESIWVDPTHRGRGIFRALLQRLADLERELGATELLLWVLEGNYAALYAYEAAGFRPTGVRQFLSAVGRFESQLSLAIGPPTD